MECRCLIFEKFEKAFKSVKRYKSSGHGNIEISYPLFMIFHSSFNERIFPEQLKVANVYPIFKVDNIK